MNLLRAAPIQGLTLAEANALLRVAISMWRDDAGILTDALEGLADACETTLGPAADCRPELEQAMQAARELVVISRASLQDSQHI